ncbi:DUF2254 domain-containing protein [Gymnodinialimonas sp. 2305UL16-5]|uniref:DUF2254 domain-containing protein n=1 Tax=Gymnodinialimonas mytili TaxID=3126503 RepID=UPI0030B11E54
MIGKWVWLLRGALRKLWLRVAAFAILAIVAAIAAPLLSPLVPDAWSEALGGDAVDQVLTILATSMLAVTTFSLSIAVNAYTAAAQTATPRAVALLQSDKITQTTLATFLGAFVYALVAIIGINAGYYAEGERAVLFLSTVMVASFVVLAMLRWIDYLQDFGRLNNTLDRVEVAARNALLTRLDVPYLGGQPFNGEVPSGAWSVRIEATGHIQHIDMQSLQDWAETNDAQLWLPVLPGDFVHPGSCFAYGIGAEPDEKGVTALQNAVTVDRQRSFDQDPRFGMVVLSEIASRALSPGVNDPGTAVDVLERQLAVLSKWHERKTPEIHCDRVRVGSVEPSEMLNLAFRPILRDGIGQVEVLVRLLDVLAALQDTSAEVFGEAAQALTKGVEDALAQTDQLDAWDRQQIETALRA